MAIDPNVLRTLEIQAVKIRLDLLEMLEPGKVGHLGGSSSAADIMAALYFYKMSVNPNNPADPRRDIFLMSKGHSVPAQYAALAELGYFGREEFPRMKTLGGLLQGHPDLMTPGIEAVTGSLGQGLSIGSGMALSFLKMDRTDNQVYVMCGDGEMAEGQLWEAAAFASFNKLSNLTMILDNNGLQAGGTCEEIMDIPSLPEKWASFGWHVIVIDGHNMGEIVSALDGDSKGCPKAIIARTVKGKGFSFAEDVVSFHNGAMTEEQHREGRKALEAKLDELSGRSL